MSCKHGEWFKCEQCDEVDAAYDRGLADAANQTGAQLECTSDYAPTRLEYFAGLAMQGDWAAQDGDTGVFTNTCPYQSLSDRAVIYVRAAQALIAELDKQP